MAASEKEWRVLPYAAKVMDRRKVTRRRAELALKMGEFFPPEGHCAAVMKRVEHDGGSFVTIAVIGGAHQQECATWPQASSLHLVEFNVEKEDVTTTDIMKLKMTGALMTPLYQAAMVTAKPGKLLVFGGLNTDYIEPTNEFHILTLEKKCHVEIVKGEHEGMMVRSRRLQQGSIPSARFGHTLTRLGNADKAILFGGLQMDQRGHDNTNLWRKFSQLPAEKVLYVLDMETLTWTAAEMQPEPRAYHKAVYLKERNSVLILGGVKYDGREPHYRYGLHECLLISANGESIHFRPFSCSGTPLHMSSFAACATEDTIFLHGGYQVNTGAMEAGLEPSQDMVLVNLESCEHALVSSSVHFKTASAGHTAICMDNACIMLLGGTNEGIFAFTSKKFCPEACDFGDKCDIDHSPEVSPIAWIGCDGPCKRWLHNFCAKVTKVPKSNEKWYCSTDCRPKKQARKKRR